MSEPNLKLVNMHGKLTIWLITIYLCFNVPVYATLFLAPYRAYANLRLRQLCTCI